PANLAASCTILHDRNNDGILDMTGIDEGADVIILFDRSCCIGIRGDINGDGINANVLDLTYMIDDIFRGGPASPCEEEADLDGNGISSNILDLTYLVDDIFRGGQDPVSCE
ncbi:MAG: hypothetical protein IH931_05310, partial [candidate division Zixibacteria bacterium]|nr:hypothetical protein [candidate division Zixibacteria bacterium]